MPKRLEQGSGAPYRLPTQQQRQQFGLGATEAPDLGTSGTLGACCGSYLEAHGTL